MLPYSFEALQSDLQGFLTTVNRISPTYWLAFKIQHVTGCRFNELRFINRFLIVDSSNFTLQPQKGNNLRTLPISIIPTEFLSMIQAQDDYFQGLRQSTASYYFRTFYFGKRIFHDNKQLTTNLFRHHFCKSLYNSGYTVAQIAYNLGERDQKNADNYIFSDLVYTAREDDSK